MHCYDKYVHVLQHTARTIVVTGFDVAPGRLALTLTFACVPVGYMDGGVAVYRWDTCMASLQPRRCEQNKRGVAKPCYLLPRGCWWCGNRNSPLWGWTVAPPPIPYDSSL